MKFCPICESCLTKTTEGESVQLICTSKCSTVYEGEPEDTLIACSFNPLDIRENDESNSNNIKSGVNDHVKSDVNNVLSLAPYDRVNKIIGVSCKTPNCYRRYMVLVSTETEGSWYVCDGCDGKFKGNEVE